MLKIVDLEATCWESEEEKYDSKGLLKISEIIEIGGVTIDLDKGIIVDKFEAFIRPVLNPKLSEFCKELTTIKQIDVDSARRFNEVYPSFVKWFGSSKKNVLASWGKYDKTQLMKDCELHKLTYLLGDDHWNLKNMFEQRFNCKKMGLNRAVEMLGMRFKGTHHRGISDAENGANVVIRMFHANKV